MADQIQVASLGGAAVKPGRLAYIDWLRGLACLGMFQAHCYNSWLNADARKTEFYRWSQAIATLPAPLFIFLAGISVAMVTQRLRDKGMARDAIARTTILRGAEIYGLGLLFRVQEFVLGYPNAPWTDLLRVDVLNILGISIMLAGVLCWAIDGVKNNKIFPQGLKPWREADSMSDLKVRPPVADSISDLRVQRPVAGSMSDLRVRPPVADSMSDLKIRPPVTDSMTDLEVRPPIAGSLSDLKVRPTKAMYSSTPRSEVLGEGRGVILAALVTAAVIAIVTPWVWTTHRPDWLPWPLESYINGVHTFAQPQPWLFPIFPWSAFAFVGLAVGFLLLSDFAKRKEIVVFTAVGVAGVAGSLLSILFDEAPVRLYSAAIYDYWHTSPNFFLVRCGILLALVLVAYAWCRWGLAQVGFSPLIQLGNTSLLVYWVHIEFVYGRFSILPKGQCSILKATGGLLIIFLAMVALSVLRTRWKKRQPKVSSATPVAAAATLGSE